MKIDSRARWLPWAFAAALLVATDAAADIRAYLDADERVVMTDGVAEPGWRLVLRIADPAALTMPEITVPGKPGATPVLRCAASSDPLGRAVRAAAAASGLDPLLIRAVITVESACNPRAISPKGARGLMQLMPDTARAYQVSDAFDPAQNIGGGARYLRDLLDMFGGNLELALAAYNAGPSSVLRAGMTIPPFRETRAYVPAVLQRLRQLRAG